MIISVMAISHNEYKVLESKVFVINKFLKLQLCVE